MQRGAARLVEPITGIKRKEFDFRTFGKVRRFIDNQAPGFHASFQCHGVFSTTDAIVQLSPCRCSVTTSFRDVDVWRSLELGVHS